MTTPLNPQSEGRRQFIKSAGRWLLAGSLLGGLAWLKQRKERSSCEQTACGRCPQLAGCRLPQARQHRPEKGGRS